MKTVIRIEHPYDGNGIWRSYDENSNLFLYKVSCYDDIEIYHDNCLLCPQHDGYGTMTSLDYCAFKDIFNFNKFIKRKWLKELIEAGFRIYSIEVSKCTVLKQQVIFRKEDIITKTDITNIFN